jgi:hypothetical protein
MRFQAVRFLFVTCFFLLSIVIVPWQRLYAGETNVTELRSQFFKLCDVTAAQLTNTQGKERFFVDSYAVRALCVAYDLTGNHKYLDACRDWSGRMVAYQEKMIPQGAYYMNYNRKPGEITNDWYSADSSSIGMAILATAVRCEGAERKRLIDSTEQFAGLVLKNYVKPSGGISDGLWSQSSDAWWCSSGIFGSFLFNLYAVTGEKAYLKTALSITGWLNDWDLTKEQPFPLSQQGLAMIFYVMENYSAGWTYIEKETAIKQPAFTKVNWCLDWISDQQNIALADRPWQATKGWGLKFAGLPFHEFVFSRYFSNGQKLATAGDAELKRLATVVFERKPEFNQLSVFLMMSYAERLCPGGVYRTFHRGETETSTTQHGH